MKIDQNSMLTTIRKVIHLSSIGDVSYLNKQTWVGVKTTLKGKNKGLTLLEVILSIAILMIIITPIISLVMSSVKTNKESTNRVQETNQMQQMMEEIKADPLNLKDKKIKTFSNGFKIIGEVSKVYNDDKTALKYPFDIKNSSSVQIEDIAKDVLIIVDDTNIHIYSNTTEKNLNYNNVKKDKIKNRTNLYPLINNQTLFLNSAEGKIGIKYTDDANENKTNYEYISKIDKTGKNGNSNESSLNKNVGIIEIVFEGREEILPNINKLKIATSNETKEAFNVYYMKVENSTNDFTYDNKYGKVNFYNINLADTKYENDSRVYNIKITLFKDLNDNNVIDDKEKIIDEIYGYKTVLQ